MSETEATLRRRLEELTLALKEGEDSVNGILETNPDGIVITGKQGDVRYANLAAAAILKIKKDDLAGYRFDFPAQAIDWTPFETTAGSGESLSLDVRAVDLIWKGRDARLVFVRVRVLDAGGNGHSKRSEDRLRLMIERAPDAVYMADLRGNFISVNAMAEEMSGYRREDWIGKSFLTTQLFSADQIPRIVKWLALLAIGRRIGPEELLLKRKDGRQIPIEIRVFPMRVGLDFFIMGIARDISKRRRLEKTIQRQGEFLRGTLNALTHPFYIVNARDYTVQMANAAARSLGIQIGKTCHGCTHGSPTPCTGEHQCPVEEVKRTGKLSIVEHLHKDAQGHFRYYEVFGYPICDEKGEVVQVIEYSRDITARKAAEKEIRNLAKFPEENPNVIMRLTPDGKILYANPSSRPLLDEWGTRIGGVVPEKLCQLAARAFESGQRQNCLRTQNKRIFSLIFAPVLGPNYINIYGTDITDLYETEVALRESEKKHRELITTSVDGVISIGPDMKICLWNRAAEKIFGYQEKEILGEDVMKLVPVRYREAKAKGMVEFAKAGAGPVIGKTVELAGLRKDGTEVLIELSVSARKTNGGFEATAIVRDITERKKTEATLRESEERYRSLFGSMMNGVAYHRMLYEGDRPVDYVYLDANPAFERLTGLKNVIGKKVTEVIPGIRESSPELFEIYGRVARSGNPEAFESCVKTMGVWFSIAVFSPRRDHFVVVFDNITERRKATEELKAANEESQLLLKSMMNAFVLFESVFDETGRFVSYRFVYINEAYERITGVRLEDVRGKTVHEVWPATEPSWIEYYGQVAVTGVSKTFEMYHDPTKKMYHCNVYRPWSSNDRFCVVFEDITERVRVEEERKRTIEDLQAFKKATVNRENQMIELKREINELSKQLGKPAPYDLTFLSD